MQIGNTSKFVGWKPPRLFSFENRQECSAWKTAKNVQLGKPPRMFCFETAKNVLLGKPPRMFSFETAKNVQFWNRQECSALKPPRMFCRICNPAAMNIRICNPLKSLFAMVSADLIGLQILILYPVGLQIRLNLLAPHLLVPHIHADLRICLNIRKSLSYRSTKKNFVRHISVKTPECDARWS